jgi:hypothetical protein
MGHSFVQPENTSTAGEFNEQLFVWIDPSKWGLAPNLRGKRVALTANSPIRGHGREIDSFDEVIRINRMEYWQRSAADDGTRITIWAGLPKRFIIWGVPATTGTLSGHTGFPDAAPALSAIWSATPFHLSVTFYNFLARRGLLNRLFVSGSGPFLHDYLAQRLPPGMVRALFTVPTLQSPSGSFAELTNFELLLTGVRLTLFCTLAGAHEVGLFGFNFYEGTEKRPGAIHNLAFEKALLTHLVKIAPRLGSQVTWYDP